MRRRVVIALSVMGTLIVILAVALASVGTQVDKIRLNRSDLELENADLQEELDGLVEEHDRLRQERDDLQTQVTEQLKAIQQLKVEKAQLERARTPTTQSPPASAEP